MVISYGADNDGYMRLQLAPTTRARQSYESPSDESVNRGVILRLILWFEDRGEGESGEAAREGFPVILSSVICRVETGTRPRRWQTFVHLWEVMKSWMPSTPWSPSPDELYTAGKPFVSRLKVYRP